MKRAKLRKLKRKCLRGGEAFPITLEGVPAERIKRLTDALTDVYRHTHDPSSFRATLDIWLCALRRFDQGQEEKYLELVSKQPKGALKDMQRGLWILIEHFFMEGYYADLLGPVYQAVAGDWGAKVLAQYFTPWNVALMLSQVTLGDSAVEKCRKGESVSVNDPCCGSGVMLLAARGLVAEQAGRDAARYVRLYGQDIDHVCVTMAKIQLLLVDERYMRDLLLATAFELKEKSRL